MAHTPRHVPLMLALTFSTGIGDAIGYLGLDKVFTGNMTGNVVILGMALVGADGLPVLGPLLALLGFMGGAAVAGYLLRNREAGWHRPTTLLFSLVAVMLAGVSGWLFAQTAPPMAVMVTMTTLIAIAMGIQAATARHISVKDVTTVVVTSTITAIAADSVGGASKGWQRRAGAILAILLGAALGAALLPWSMGAAIALSAVITAAVTVIGHLEHRKDRAFA